MIDFLSSRRVFRDRQGWAKRTLETNLSAFGNPRFADTTIFQTVPSDREETRVWAHSNFSHTHYIIV